MAIRRGEGFGHFTSSADWALKGCSSAGSAPTFSPTLGRAGRGCAILAGHTTQWLNIIPAVACNPIYLHLAFFATDLNDIFFCFYNSSNYDNIHVRFQADGSIRLYVGTGVFGGGANPGNVTFTTVVATSPGGLWRANVWHHVQIAYTESPTAGRFLLKLDGVEVTALTQTSGDLHAGGPQTTSRVAITGVTAGTISYSDLVITDDVIDDSAVQQYTGLQGELAVYEDVNPVDGDNLDWTRSVASGTHASYVNQNPQDGDTTYVRSAAAGSNECFSYPTITSAIGTVLAVKETVCHRKEDTSFGGLRPYLRDSADVNHEGALKVASTSYKFDEYFWEKDPLTGASWSIAGVNASQLGVTDCADEG